VTSPVTSICWNDSSFPKKFWRWTQTDLHQPKMSFFQKSFLKRQRNKFGVTSFDKTWACQFFYSSQRTSCFYWFPYSFSLQSEILNGNFLVTFANTFLGNKTLEIFNFLNVLFSSVPLAYKEGKHSTVTHFFVTGDSSLWAILNVHLEGNAT